MGVLASLDVYKGKYTLTKTEIFDEEDLALIESCVIVESTQYEGKLALCMKDPLGQLRYLPLSENSSLAIGDTPDPKSLVVFILDRPGSKTIKRVDLAV